MSKWANRRNEHQRHLAGRSIRFFLKTVVFFGLLFGLWQVWRIQQAESETKLIQPVQAVLDLERDAVLNGDGELFLSLQIDDPAWISAQLRPENQAAIRAGLRVAHAEQYEDFIWANEGDFYVVIDSICIIYDLRQTQCMVAHTRQVRTFLLKICLNDDDFI